jgi:hypothetical protein
MDAESAPRGRHVACSGAPQLASAPDRAAHLQIYAYVPRSHSYFVAGHGQRAAAAHADQAAHSLPHVLVLRALRETAQIHAHCGARVSGKTGRDIGRNVAIRREAAPERSAAAVELCPASAMPAFGARRCSAAFFEQCAAA